MISRWPLLARGKTRYSVQILLSSRFLGSKLASTVLKSSKGKAKVLDTMCARLLALNVPEAVNSATKLDLLADALRNKSSAVLLSSFRL